MFEKKLRQKRSTNVNRCAFIGTELLCRVIYPPNHSATKITSPFSTASVKGGVAPGHTHVGISAINRHSLTDRVLPRGTRHGPALKPYVLIRLATSLSPCIKLAVCRNLYRIGDLPARGLTAHPRPVRLDNLQLLQVDE